jgi:RNA-directed DNA polymerase
MSTRTATVARGLAGAFLAGDWDPPQMTLRGQRAVAQRRVWVRDLALAAWHGFPTAPRDRPRELAAFLAVCPPLVRAFERALRRHEPEPRVVKWFLAPTAMGVSRWPVRRLDDLADLAALFGLSPGDLSWFCDTRGLERVAGCEALRHYRYRWVAKRSGGLRLIEEPKPVLKHLQRVVLREILDRIPVHPAAHGFCRDRSAASYAAVHCGRAVVVHVDLSDFFASVGAGRVFATFRQCGYPEAAAYALTGLVTNSVPRKEFDSAPRPAREDLREAHNRLGRWLAHPHLPQGAPTSPALANLAALGVDRRLSGLAESSGGVYARYADDLAFSWPDRRSDRQLERFLAWVDRVVADEGFRINAGKTAIRRAGERQRLAGIVVNERPNIERREYERLKALLHNCERTGPAEQNRARHPRFGEHVRGRIAWVSSLNPSRGERLEAAFARIDWESTGPAVHTRS